MAAISPTMLDVVDIDNTIETPGRRSELVTRNSSYAEITDSVCYAAESPHPPLAWYVAFAISTSLTMMLGLMVTYLLFTGIGVWGNNSPVFWAWDIVNFVFWVGIGHAGTLISAILFLFRQNWRTSINRAAEAMTIFAVVCAGMFPTIHVGRIWVIYYLIPYGPNQHAIWPQFRSPLLWDVFAVSTYATVSLLFWYMGMIPDLATFRDRATTRWKYNLYGLLSLGWTGSARHWHRYERAYLLLAALATPLVLSVHTVVSFDFATSQIPGWHTTIFPYFVAGAIFGGFGMVVTLLVPARALFGLEHLITLRHMENMNKVILATGTIVGYAYAMEFFIAWYGGNPYEQFAFTNRMFGPYAWAYWTMIACNVISPQVFWFKKCRTSPLVMWIVSIFVNIGMWFERFVIVVISLSRDYLPSSWGYYSPTWVDILTLIGSFGLFTTLFLLFCRFLPIVAMAEVKGVVHQHNHAVGHHEHDAAH